MAEKEIKIKIDTADICKDSDARQDKQKVLKNGKWYSMMFSVSDALKYAAAILLPVAIAILVPELKGLAEKGTSLLQFPAAIAATNLGGIGLSMLGTAAAIMTLGIATQYIGSRQLQNSQLDNSEMNSLHTARYMVKELKKEMSGMHTQQPIIVVQAQNQESEIKARADGKSWSQVVADQAAAAKAQQPVIG